MDGISRIAGVGPSLVLGGERLVVRALRLKDFALIEAEVLRSLTHPFTAIRKAWQIHGNKELLRRVCETAVTKCWGTKGITLEQYAAWRLSPTGRLMVLWMSLDRPAWQWFVDAVHAETKRDFMFMHRADHAVAQANATDEWNVDDSQRTEPYQWDVILRRLVDTGISPEQAWDMTLTQAVVALCPEDDLGDKVKAQTRREMQHYAEKVRLRKAAITEQLMRDCE